MLPPPPSDDDLVDAIVGALGSGSGIYVVDIAPGPDVQRVIGAAIEAGRALRVLVRTFEEARDPGRTRVWAINAHRHEGDVYVAHLRAAVDRRLAEAARAEAETPERAEQSQAG